MTVTTTPHLPSYGDDVRVVVPAPGLGAGNWAGAASAVRVDGTFWLTWRVRRPLTEGRGVSVVVARSSDGESFEQVVEVERDALGAESSSGRSCCQSRGSAGGSISLVPPPAPSTGGSTA